MPLKYLKSVQGTPLLFLDGFIYEKDKEADKTYWKCNKYKLYSCAGRVHTKNDEVIFDNNGHNHLEETVEAQVRWIKSEVKKRAVQDFSVKASDIVADITSDVSEAVINALPSTNGLKRSAWRVRNKIVPRRKSLLERMNDNEIACPVCNKKFLKSMIEEHASKCLFLHESSTNFIKSPKRDILNVSSSTPAAKKIKQEQNVQPDGKKTAKIFLTRPTRTTVKNQAIETSDAEEHQNTQETQSEPQTTIKNLNENQPLAERMRPNSLESYIGQSHVLSPNSILYKLLSKGEVPNFILWGPPGCGKTSLANVVANISKQKNPSKIRFVKLSAAVAGVNDVREHVQRASNELKFGRKTIIFMDEIHRFNKMQQDIFLPHVESGTITLIGATTENPSFSLNSALLSRCRVIALEKLDVPHLMSILVKAVNHMEGQIIGHPKEMHNEILTFTIDKDTLEWLAETCDGDARIALNGLELAVHSKLPSIEHDHTYNTVSITLEDVKESLKKSHTLYDRKGDQHYDMISALHKSVRAGDDNAALYWLARMMAGGEDPVYIARRLVRMASEDIGLADPQALGIAVHTMHACKMIGMPECDVCLAQCVTYLARAPKSRSMEDALRAAQKLVADYKGPQPGVPLHLRNAPTKLMKNFGYGQGYNMQSKDISGLTYLPEELEYVNFFE